MAKQYPNVTLVPDYFSYTLSNYVPMAKGGTAPSIFQPPFTDPQLLISQGLVGDVTDVLADCGALDKFSPSYVEMLAGFKDLKEFMSSTSILPRSFDLAPFLKTWSQLGIAKNYLNSLISVIGSVVCALLFNGLLGYGLAILKPKGYGVVKKLVMLSLLVPATISIVPLFMNIQRLKMGNSFLPLWLSYGANAMYVVLFIQFFESLPNSMIEASRIDGCSPLQTFFHIVLPLSKPICAVVTIFAINASWSDFLLPYLVLRSGPMQTVMVRLFVFSTEQTVNADAMMRSVVFSMIPPILLFALFQKQLTENTVSAGIKG